MTLSKQQAEAVEAIRRWHGDSDDFGGDPFRLFGPAGTGKTTLAREVPAALGLDPRTVLYAAYTGKAADVLRSKGCAPASTLHSLVYRPIGSEDTREALRQARERLAVESVTLADGLERGEGQDWADDQGVHIQEVRAEIQALEAQLHTVGFEWNESSRLADARLLILDEVSMVGPELAMDIERFNVPVLVLGDPEQLEPVGGEGYFIDAPADYALTEIHRQALDSPVLELATRVRSSTDARLGLTRADLTPRSLAEAMDHDQIIVWKNATRWSLINGIRKRLGRPAGIPVPGDRVMCLTNNRDLGIFNGQQFDVVSAKSRDALVIRDDQGAERTVATHLEGFQGRDAQEAAKAGLLGGRGSVGLFTFANAITAHKAQGSEWGSVYVVNETPAMIDARARHSGRTAALQSARRWMYTAATRASERVTVTVPK